MIRLKSLTFQNIGRFVEEQTIDFTKFGPLTQINGRNLNTNGSSGSGKTTVFKALDFLLGLKGTSNAVLQSRLTKKSIAVTGLFELNGVSLKIERGEKLLIDLNGEIVSGSSKLTEEKLDELIGMPRDLFRKVMHKRQGEGGFFLDMGPTEIHKFLTDCLGLQKEQLKIVTLDSRLEVLSKSETSTKSSLESFKAGLDATKTATLALGLPPVLGFDPGALQILWNKFHDAVAVHKLAKEALIRELADLETTRPKVETIPFDRSKIESLEKSLIGINEQIAVLEKAEQNRQSVIKNNILALQEKVINLENIEVNRQSEVKDRLSLVQREISRLENAEIVRQSAARSSHTLNSLSLLRAKATSADGSKAKEGAKNLAKELETIRKSLCPTCEQGWVTDAAKAKEAEILEKLQECKKRVIAGMAADKEIVTLEEQQKQILLDIEPRLIENKETLQAQVTALTLEAQRKVVPETLAINTEIDKLRLESLPKPLNDSELKKNAASIGTNLTLARQEERDHQSSESQRTQATLAIFSQKQTDLRSKHEVVIKMAQDMESQANTEHEAVKNSIKSFEDSKKRYDESYDKLKSQETLYQNQVSATGNSLSVILEEIEIATESKKAIKSYLSCSFEDALNAIGDEATKLIRSIPNMATATIQLDGLKESKEGKIKEEVNAVISMDGEIGIPVKSLSGGEKSSVDLGIDLAVIRFIEETTNKGIDFFALDEPFTGLDSQCCEDAIEMLKNCTTGKRIFLVDHNPQVAQAIESHITVVRDGLTSHIEQ